MRIGGLILALALFVAPGATAGTQEAPEVADAAGDAGPNGTAAPVGFGWGDIVAAWFEAESPQSFTIKLAVVDSTVPPQNAVVGVQFNVGSRVFLSGWGTFFGAPAGFLCETDANGQPMNCTDSQEATLSGPLYTISNIPRDFVGALDQGAILGEPQGFAGQIVFVFDPTGMVPLSAGQYVPVDDTPVGKAYTFATGIAKQEAEQGEEAVEEAVGGTTSGDEELAQTAAPEQPPAPQQTPGFEIVLVLVGVAAIAVTTRRSR